MLRELIFSNSRNILNGIFNMKYFLLFTCSIDFKEWIYFSTQSSWYTRILRLLDIWLSILSAHSYREGDTIIVGSRGDVVMVCKSLQNTITKSPRLFETEPTVFEI